MAVVPQRCGHPGRTKSSYRLTTPDKGKKLTVMVTGAKVGYQSWSRSKSTGKVKEGR